jgi:hypothetical protein
VGARAPGQGLRTPRSRMALRPLTKRATPKGASCRRPLRTPGGFPDLDPASHLPLVGEVLFPEGALQVALLASDHLALHHHDHQG